MTSSSSQSSDREQQLQEILTEYLELMESGDEPDRDSFLARYPDFADELKSFLDDRDSIERFVAPMRNKKKTAVEIEPTIGTEEAAPPEPCEVVRYFGDYELLEEIARGGMGVVYKARQVSLNRIVALKMILAGQLASEQDVQRFHTEAEAAANLDHPNIVPIYEVGEHEGLHYFSMGFVDGHSLAERLAEGPLPSREAAELTKTLADAVAYAHEQGVIHRDLKPANVLIDSRGEPRITDFGLARREDDDSGMTATGQILGTPSYMPPEQALGKNEEIGPQADVYALGATLYSLITGRPPFQGASIVETLKQLQEQDPVAPRQLNTSIERDLETICLKCLQKEKDRRYVSATEFSQDLDRYLLGKPIIARPIGRSARAWRWCRRNPVIASMSAALLVLLLVGTVFSSYFALQARQQAANAEEQLWQSRLERARAERLAGDPFAAKATIRSAAQHMVTNELQTEAILAATTGGVKFVWEWPDRQGRDFNHASLNYDASLLAASIGQPEHAVQVRRVGSGELVAEFDRRGPIGFSPTTNLLAVGGRDQVALWNVIEDKVIGRWSTTFINHERPFCFSNDGEMFSFSQRDGSSAAVYEIATGRLADLPVTGPRRSVYPVGFLSRDLLALRRASHYLIWNLRTNQLELDTEKVWRPAIETGESLVLQDAFPLVLAYGDRGGRFRIDPESGERIEEQSQRTRLISIFDLKSRQPVAEKLDTPLPYQTRWEVNGALGLAATEEAGEPQAIRLYDLRLDRARGRLVKPGFSGSALVQPFFSELPRNSGSLFSSDGATFAAMERNSQGGDVSIRLWDINRGRSLAYLHRHAFLGWNRDALIAVKDPHIHGCQLRVYQFSAGVPSYAGRIPIQTLTFDKDGKRLAVNDNIWGVHQHGRQSYLRPLTSNSGGDGTFVSSGSRQWVIRTGDHRKGENVGFPNATVEKIIVEEVFRPSRRFELKAQRKPISFPPNVKPITDFVVDPNGRWVAFHWNYQLLREEEGRKSASYASCMELWNLERSASVLQLDEESYYVHDPIGLTADGRVCAARGFRFSSFQPRGDERVFTYISALKFWDAKTGESLPSVDLKWTALPGEALSISFDAETSRIARSGKALFTTGTYTEVPEPGAGQDDGAEEGRRQHVAAVIDLEEGVVRHVLRGSQDRITSIAESPDGRWLVAGGADNRLSIWNVESGRRIAAWPAHQAEITALAFHPDGRVLCSGDDNGTIKLWDLDRIGRELKEMGLPWD